MGKTYADSLIDCIARWSEPVPDELSGLKDLTHGYRRLQVQMSDSPIKHCKETHEESVSKKCLLNPVTWWLI